MRLDILAVGRDIGEESGRQGPWQGAAAQKRKDPRKKMGSGSPIKELSPRKGRTQGRKWAPEAPSGSCRPE
ncbi:MAG: hypothetical protein ACI4FX_10470, partial [Agathobacter sp.]